MEDIKQYIESGILELYILDTLSAEEKFEVESMAAKYPSVQKELDEISRATQLFAELNAIEPPEGLRTTILNQLIGDNEISVVPTLENDKDDRKIVPLQPVVKQTNFYKYAFAASIALLLVSVIALLNTHNQLQESKQQLLSLQEQNQRFANQVLYQENQLNKYKQSDKPDIQVPVRTDSNMLIAKDKVGSELLAVQSQLKQSKKRILALESENKNHEKELNIFADPGTRVIRLKGLPFSPSSNLLLTWNPEKKQLWINKKASTLPENDREHQYQLWAITKLKPVSLGVFDIDDKDSSIMKRMESIDKATAFAVTLEPRGGSEKPTLKQMMVMGVSHK